MSAAPFPATRAIVGFSRSFELDSVSAATLEKAKQLVLDLLGVILAARDHDPDRALALARLQEPAAGGGATAIGAANVYAPADAALVNGYLAHRLELDDSTLNPIGHPSATILPAVLALGEAHGLSGRRALEAYLIGLEVHSRLGQAQLGNWSATDPWLPIGHIGMIGAAAATARLLDLTTAQTEHCIGIAAHLACQLNVSNGSLAKAIGAGQSARNAIMAAQLAQIGITGAADAIERPGGFADTFLAYGGEVDLESPLRRLGTPLHLEEVGVAIKRYPSCYGTHWGIDALREMLEQHALGAADVRSVELTYPPPAAFLDDPAPETEDAARFSHQYGLAACLADGHPRPSSYAPARVRSQTMRELLGRVRAQAHPPQAEPPEAWRYEVSVTTGAGERHAHWVKHPRGHPRNPLAAAEVEAKFAEQAGGLGASACGWVVELVARLDELPDVGELLAELREVGTGQRAVAR